MAEAVPVYRVSRRFLGNLWQQALFGGLGILSSWGLFLTLSFIWVPAIPFDQILSLPQRALLDTRIWGPQETGDLIRYWAGPFLALCVIPGGLGDFSSWLSVQYEIQPDKLRMRWRRLTRDIAWDLIHTVDERPHTDSIRSSLKVEQTGAGPILIRGLENLSDVIAILRERLPRRALWKVTPIQVDLTGWTTNFLLGFALMIPIAGSWFAYYVAGLTSLALFWSVGVLLIALWIWVQRPLSRSHMCVREVEIFMIGMLILLSGVITFINWIQAQIELPPVISRFLGL